MMGRAVDPGRPHQVFPSEQQAGGLRPAQAFAPAIGHERCAVLQVHVGNRQNLCRGVDHDRHTLRLGDRRNGFHVERAVVRVRAGKNVDHRGPWPERGLELGERRYFDDAHADGAKGRVVHVARMRRDDSFVFREAWRKNNQRFIPAHLMK